MREKLQRFMYGRYGSDQLNRFLLIFSLFFWLISLFTTEILYIIGIIGLVLAYFRLFSKNIYKRAAENRVYLTYENKVKAFWRGTKARFRQAKTHHVFKCPSCGQKIRVPRGRGMIEITCPKCRGSFIKRS